MNSILHFRDHLVLSTQLLVNLLFGQQNGVEVFSQLFIDSCKLSLACLLKVVDVDHRLQLPLQGAYLILLQFNLFLLTSNQVLRITEVLFHALKHRQFGVQHLTSSLQLLMLHLHLLSFSHLIQPIFLLYLSFFRIGLNCLTPRRDRALSHVMLNRVKHSLRLLFCLMTGNTRWRSVQTFKLRASPHCVVRPKSITLVPRVSTMTSRGRSLARRKGFRSLFRVYAWFDFVCSCPLKYTESGRSSLGCLRRGPVRGISTVHRWSLRRSFYWFGSGAR